MSGYVTLKTQRLLIPQTERTSEFA